MTQVNVVPKVCLHLVSIGAILFYPSHTNKRSCYASRSCIKPIYFLC